jgi:hypothetical protein
LHSALTEGLEACASVAQLQAWVERVLRPAYGRVKLGWVEELRKTYGDKLARLAMMEQP